jgi:hypothetical protein
MIKNRNWSISTGMLAKFTIHPIKDYPMNGKIEFLRLRDVL